MTNTYIYNHYRFYA